MLEFHLQTVKGAKVYNAAVAAVSDGTTGEKEGEEKLKLHTHSYCCLDYAQVCFVPSLHTRWRVYIFVIRLEELSVKKFTERSTLFVYFSLLFSKGMNHSRIKS